MGYMMVMARCGQCGEIFSFNPASVPSLNNIPYCKACIDAANPVRIKNGLDPIVYAADAYEAIDENEW